MSADLLRLILIIAGIGLILGIYFWERNKRIDASVHAVRRQREFDEPSLGEDIETGDTVSPVTESEFPVEAETVAVKEVEDEMPPTPAFLMQDEQGKGDIAEELQRLNGLVSEKETVSTGEQLPFFFAADEDEEADREEPAAPVKIMMINIKARHGCFGGRQVQEAAVAAGMEHGEMEIFHRMNPSAAPSKSAPLYSMASMVEPGIFPRDAMDEFNTPGLALFLQLPSRGDDLTLFNEMLATAEQLAKSLDGELQDETHSVLTRQTIEHLRGEIIEFQRKQRLAQKKS
jgi:cell division protein ZipA